MVTTPLENETGCCDAENDGGGTTVTENDLASLKGGVPLSVTRTVKLFVVPANESSGVHAKIPFAGFTVAATGELLKLNVKMFTGKSGSAAKLVIVSVVPA